MTSTLRTVFTATRAALLVVSASLPAQAANEVAHRGTSVYDGAWSVVIQTTHGDCPAAVRAGVHISAGRVLANDQSYSVEGRVAPNGAIRVNVSAAGQGPGGCRATPAGGFGGVGPANVRGNGRRYDANNQLTRNSDMDRTRARHRGSRAWVTRI